MKDTLVEENPPQSQGSSLLRISEERMSSVSEVSQTGWLPNIAYPATTFNTLLAFGVFWTIFEALGLWSQARRLSI